MKHRIGFNRLERRQGHRKALKNNMVTSLFRYERVATTKAKALEIKRVAEKMVTRARVDSVHNRRLIAQHIHDKEVLAKLFTEIAPRYLERPGGYTRVLKTGRRQGDAAETVILELVDRVIEEKVRRTPEKEAVAEAEAVVEEEEAEAPEAEAEVSTEEATAEEESDVESVAEEAGSEGEAAEEGESEDEQKGEKGASDEEGGGSEEEKKE